MSTPLNLVVFAHGKESGPWGTKIKALSKIARKNRFQVVSPDYSFTQDADERVEYLIKLKPKARRNLILVGSSMGGYVSAVASKILKPGGLFLMAPAFYIPHYSVQSPKPVADHTLIIHGWQDTVIPVEHSFRYAKKYHSELHLLNSDHKLTSQLPAIEKLFKLFLKKCLAG